MDLKDGIQTDNLVELWRSFASTWKKWYKKAEENIAPLDISIPEYRMMTYLDEHGPTPMAKLAFSIDVSQGWITSMVDRLEKKQMVCRTRNEEDRRIIKIGVLDRGRIAIENSRELHLKFVKRTLGKFSPEEQLQFKSLLEKLYMNLTNEPDP